MSDCDENIKKPKRNKTSCVKELSLVMRDYKMSQDDIDKENIKIICATEFFIKNLFRSLTMLYKTVDQMLTELYHLMNELNFRNVDEQYIEEYNKLLMFMHENIRNILNTKVASVSGMDSLIINEPDNEHKLFMHKIEMITIQPGGIYETNYLGDISNMSMTKINNQMVLQRGKKTFIFVLFNNIDTTTVDIFRSHLEDYVMLLREMLGLIYTDLIFVKQTFKTFLKIVGDLLIGSIRAHTEDVVTNENKDFSKKVKRWKKMIRGTKCVMRSVEEYIKNLNFIMS
jgi:hypothetical protein